MWARSDVISLSLGVHGCGASHSREVTRGVPAKHFSITCEPCEAHLRGDRKQKKLVYETDRKTGQVLRQARVQDGDPLWSSTSDTVPLSPDQEKTHALRVERGEQQLRALESIATLAKAGIDFTNRPDVLFFLRENQLPEDLLQGSVLCVNDHPNVAGVKFCGECGASMAARAAVEPPAAEPEEPSLDLARLHPQTLKAMCRKAGLPDKGSKDELISRLAA
jgi:hypothetical protein